MSDTTTSVEQLKKTVTQFVEEREWQQFHSPKNLSMALASEAAELMDLFLWCDNAASYDELEKRRKEVEDEIVDVTKLVLSFCVRHNIDLTSAMERKLTEDAQKYPIEKCKGRSVKYNQL